MYLAAYYAQFQRHYRRFKDAEALNKNEDEWNKQRHPQFPPTNFKLATDELIREWDELRMEYSRAFQTQYIAQLQFMRILKDMEPNPLSRTFISKSIEAVKLRDHYPLSFENKHIRTKLKKKSIELYGSSQGPEGQIKVKELWCPVRCMMLPSVEIKCAHIVPFSFRNVANYIFGDPMHVDIVNQPENTMMVSDRVETAMNLGRIAFAPVEGSQSEVTEFRVVIIDPTILEEPGTEWKVSTPVLHGIDN
jgi:hypothetical protein